MAPPSTGGPDAGVAEDWGDVADAFEAVERAPRLQECLNLNVWTPDPGATGLPVMVWIQGGMFELSSTAAYDGSRFARDGVVCVVINWRPGPRASSTSRTGSPTSGSSTRSPPFEWVRDNIAGFGGDPDNVTVFGESAGAMSIGALLAMPAARGLFHRAILQSGAAQHVTPPEDALMIAGHLADVLGVARDRDAIAAVGVGRLLAAQAELKADLLGDPDPARWGLSVVTTTMPWQPVIDGDVLPAPPLERIGAGSARGVDVLVGTNVDDWRLWLVVSGAIGRITDEVLTGPVNTYGHQSLAAYGVNPATALAAYRHRYPQASPGDLLTKVQTDWWMRIPAIRLADSHAGASGDGTHVHVRVRVGLTRVGCRARIGGAVRLRHREHGRTSVRPLARSGPTAGAGPDHARRVGRLRHGRRPRLAAVRPRYTVHDEVRHDVGGGEGPTVVGAGAVARHPLMVSACGVGPDGRGVRR